MEYLLKNPIFVKSANVIELGAGTGISGMLCKQLGCASVFLTDHDQRSLDHMLLDTARNDISANVLHLDWYQYDHKATLQLLQPSDDSLSPPSSSAVRIVAGDVLYKSALIVPFFTVISSLLGSCSGSEMLLCHVPRAGVEQQQVVATCEQYGLSVSRVAHDEWKKGIVVEYSTPDDYERAELYLIKMKIS